MKNKRREFRTLSFRTEITAIILLISLAVAFSMLFAFNRRYAEALESSIIENSKVLANQARTNIESYQAEMLSIALHVEKALNENPDSIDLVIEKIHELLEYVEGITVFDWQGKVLFSGAKKSKPDYNIHSSAWIDVRALYSDGSYFSEPHVQDLSVSNYPWVISLSRFIEWTGTDGARERGLVVVDFGFASFKNILEEASSPEGYAFVINQYAEIIYHPHQQLIYLGLKSENISSFVLEKNGSEISSRSGVDSVYTYTTLDYSKWKIINVEPLKNVYAYDALMSRDIFAIVVIIVVFTVMLAFNISHLVSNPINRLTKLVRRVFNRDYKNSEKNAKHLDSVLTVNPAAFTNIQGASEIRELGQAFGEVLEQNSNLMKQIISEQDQLRESELRALQAQINPHFLYNTLDSIVWQAENNETKSVVTMTTALAEFFRSSISSSNDVHPLTEEFRHARSYLTIQQHRYKDKFDYEILLGEGTGNIKVIRLLLQPFIENAIYHGMDGFPDKCHLIIKSGLINDRLRLQVIDNGWGMDLKTNGSVLNLEPIKGSGIGISNVQKRIQLKYGPPYGLEFFSEPEEGTTVNIWLPADVAENQES